jgi:hypothetical protein
LSPRRGGNGMAADQIVSQRAIYAFEGICQLPLAEVIGAAVAGAKP